MKVNQLSMLSLALIMLLSVGIGIANAKPGYFHKIYMEVHRYNSLLPTELLNDTTIMYSDSAIVSYMLRNRWYPYPDTVRYSYSNTEINGDVFGSNDFYEGDTVALRIMLQSLEDSIYFDVGNSLPDSIYFRIFEYSDFTLSDSDSVSTQGLTFIYRGKDEGLGPVPTKLDSSNFYLKEEDHFCLFYDIVGLQEGIYEILPTFTIFDADSQGYGYKRIWTLMEGSGTSATVKDTIIRRKTLPLYIRENSGWVDSVNVFLSNGIRYALVDSVDKAHYYLKLSKDLYPGSLYVILANSWVNEWSFRFSVGKQIKEYFLNMRSWQKDWYLERFNSINSGL